VRLRSYTSLYEAIIPQGKITVNREFLTNDVKADLKRFESITRAKLKAAYSLSKPDVKDLIDWIDSNLSGMRYNTPSTPIERVIEKYLNQSVYNASNRHSTPKTIQDFEDANRHLSSSYALDLLYGIIDKVRDKHLDTAEEMLQLFQKRVDKFFAAMWALYARAINNMKSQNIDFLNYKSHPIEIHHWRNDTKLALPYIGIIEKCVDAVIKEGFQSQLKSVSTILLPTKKSFKTHLGGGMKSSSAFYSSMRNREVIVIPYYDPAEKSEIFTWLHEFGHHLHLGQNTSQYESILNQLDKEYLAKYKAEVKNSPKLFPRKYSTMNYKEWFADLFAVFMCYRYFGMTPNYIKDVAPESLEILRAYLQHKFDVSIMNEQANK